MITLFDFIVLVSLFGGIVWCVYIAEVIIYRLFFDKEWKEIMEKESKRYESLKNCGVNEKTKKS